MCLIVGLGFTPRGGAEETRGTPTYTNEDLERLAPYRGQTGVLSTPASPGGGKAAAEPKGRGEAYWRREAERLRTRLRPLRRRAEELRLRLEETRAAEWAKRSRSGRGAGGASGASGEALRRRLESVESEIRDREDELHERARREGALPGWLR